MFHSMTEETAMQRLILIKIVNSSRIPISNTSLTEIAIESFDMNFFIVQQHLSELTGNRFLIIDKSNSQNFYLLTDAGKEVLKLFNDKITDEVHQKIEALFVDNNLEQGAEAFYSLSESGEYWVYLKLTDRGLKIFELTLSVPDEPQAERICSGWTKNHAAIFGRIMDVVNRV